MVTPTQPADSTKKSVARRFSLRTSREVRGEIAKVYREFRTGAIDGGEARDAGYLLKILLDALRTDDLEARLAALEEQPAP